MPRGLVIPLDGGDRLAAFLRTARQQHIAVGEPNGGAEVTPALDWISWNPGGLVGWLARPERGRGAQARRRERATGTLRASRSLNASLLTRTFVEPGAVLTRG